MKRKNMLLVAFFLTLFVVQEVQAGATSCLARCGTSVPAEG
ncbi:MAG: hypothetical protein AB1564_07520 [Chloroflexota bacterium]